MICPRCSKDVAGVHTCKPTGLVRDLEDKCRHYEAVNAELIAERDALKVDAKAWRNFQKQLKEATAIGAGITTINDTSLVHNAAIKEVKS